MLSKAAGRAPLVYGRGGQPVRDQEPHFFTVLPQRATSYTWTSPHRSLTRAHAFSQLDLL